MRQIHTSSVYLSKKERNGLYSIVLIVSAAILIPILWKGKLIPTDTVSIFQNSNEVVERGNKSDYPHKVTQHKFFKKKYDGNNSQENLNTLKNGARPISAYPFDPNFLSQEDADKLGFPKQAFLNLRKYLDKGGKIKKKEDLQKIYGMSSEFYQKIEAFILLPVQNQKKQKDSVSHIGFLPIQKLEINAASLDELAKLPGMSFKIANKINSYKNKLGGFLDVLQVSEVYGLKDSSFQIIKPFLFCKPEINRLKINELSLEDLASHPYVSWNQAKYIVAYRNQHGKLNDKGDLRKIIPLEEKWIEKVHRYFNFE